MEHVFRLLVAQRFQLAFGGRIVGMLQQGVFCLCNRQGAIDGLLEDVAVDATHKNDVGAARSERCGTNKGHGRFCAVGNDFRHAAPLLSVGIENEAVGVGKSGV